MFEAEVQMMAAFGPALLAKIVAAMVIGFLLGFEREKKGKPLGVLTAILVALGSLLFTEVGKILHQGSATADATRVAAAIVTGIGFIGGGAIMRSKFHVTGLTSAALVWCLGSLGVLISSGLVLSAVLIAAVVFLTLRFVPAFEHWAFKGSRCVHAEIIVEGRRLDTVLDYLQENQIAVANLSASKDGDRSILSINECGFESRKGILRKVLDLDGVVDVVDYHKVSP